LGTLARVEAAELLAVPADRPAQPWYLREPDAKPQQ
jgi:hypothetical protein